MITAADFVQLPFPRDLTEAGLVYARRVLLNRQGPASASLYGAVRRTVASAALNLAFRRYLSDKGIPTGAHRTQPFSDPDRYDLELGGRSCELKAFLISRAPQWRSLVAEPQLALDAPALVPLDRHVSETLRAGDAYGFAFVGAGVAARAEASRSGGAAEGEFWMHVMPPSWRGTGTQAPLGPLNFEIGKTDGPDLELGGRDLSGAPVECNVRLMGVRSVDSTGSLLALNHLCAARRPAGGVRVHARARRLAHVVEPADWHNVWLDGWGILILGWITREEFGSRASLIPQGRRVYQFDRTKTRNMAVAVSELKPFARLFQVPGARLLTE
jgi:hypothetical protein